MTLVPPAATARAREYPSAPPWKARVRAALAGLPGRDLAAILATVLVWASLHPIGKLTFQEITTSQLPFARAALASVFLFGICAATGRLPRLAALTHPRELWKASALGLTGFALSGWLSMTALGHLPAGVSSVLANVSPLMVALGLVVLLRQRLARRTVVGLVVGFAGVVLIALRGGIDASGLSLFGVTLSLAGSASWAVYTALARRLSAGHDVICMSAAASFVGALPLAGVVLAEGQLDRLLSASLTTHLLLLWCGVVATGATFTMWVLLLRRIDAARVSSFQYLIPLFALVLAYPIAGEPPTPIVLVGAATIVLGVATANAGARHGSRRA